MTDYISAGPAYGRDYATPDEVLRDWLDHKDFRIYDLRYRGTYVNRDDLPPDMVLNIRYSKMTEVLPVNRDGAVQAVQEDFQD